MADASGLVDKVVTALVGAALGAVGALATWRVRMVRYGDRLSRVETKLSRIEKRQVVTLQVLVEVARQAGVDRKWEQDFGTFMLDGDDLTAGVAGKG